MPSKIAFNKALDLLKSNNETLTYLKLSRNEIKKEEVKALSEALTVNTVLTKLDI